MKRSVRLVIVLLVLVLMGPVACCVTIWVRERQIPSNPPATFQDSDLVGTWEAHYWPGAVDRLVIGADGTFKQTYREGGNIVYETPWNKWWVERFLDGRVRLHLEGARNYCEIEVPGMSFKDPFSGELLEMAGELILNVRRLPSDELILYHMWRPGDSGAFPLVGRDPAMFRRVKAP